MPQRRRALITGSTAGIGLSIAERLASDGFDVVLNHARDGDRANRALARIRDVCPAAELVRADVTDEDDVARLFDEARAAGPIDVLVNNVGAFLSRPFLETTLRDWRAVIDSNLISAVLCSREALPAMRNRGGLIVNVASLHADAIRATPNTLPYGIAKSGIVGLTKTLAKTEGRFGIRVNAVCPGFVNTEDAHNPPDVTNRIPLGRLAEPSEIASVVAFLASADAAYVSGAVINVHGGALL